jgi:hypothetical protein
MGPRASMGKLHGPRVGASGRSREGTCLDVLGWVVVAMTLAFMGDAVMLVI